MASFKKYVEDLKKNVEEDFRVPHPLLYVYSSFASNLRSPKGANFQ